NAGAIVLHVTAFGNLIAWRGNIDGNWDVNTTANWSGTGGLYSDGAAVTFDDTAIGTTNIAIAAGGVSPSSVTFNNATLAYTIGGAGGINGSVGLVKNGAGSVTLNGTNGFTGAVQVNAGTLNIASASAVASAASITL